jgi:hypothetical protein
LLALPFSLQTKNDMRILRTCFQNKPVMVPWEKWSAASCNPERAVTQNRAFTPNDFSPQVVLKGDMPEPAS